MAMYLHFNVMYGIPPFFTVFPTHVCHPLFLLLCGWYLKTFLGLRLSFVRRRWSHRSSLQYTAIVFIMSVYIPMFTRISSFLFLFSLVHPQHLSSTPSQRLLLYFLGLLLTSYHSISLGVIVWYLLVLVGLLICFSSLFAFCHQHSYILMNTRLFLMYVSQCWCLLLRYSPTII